MTQPLLQAADLRGAARLTTDAVVGLASLVEAMHARITSLPRLPGTGATASQERTFGVAGLVYRTVRGVTRVVGGSAEALVGCLAPALTSPDPQQAPRPEREAILAALNGVLGDYLATIDSPLAIAMQFRHAGRAVPLERHALRSRLGHATPKVLVLLHGLCMNDLQWQRAGHDHGEALARDLGYTPVYLHYNSGLSISTNGRILAPLLEQLFDAWPVPIERLVLLGHSMGGLVVGRFVAEALAAQPAAWSRPVDALVMSSPALDPGMNGVQKLLLAVLGPLLPDLALGNGLKPAWVSRDPAVVTAYTADPLVHDRITPRLVRFIVDGGALVRERAMFWRVPTLLLYAGADRCVAPAGSDAFAAAAPAEAVSHKRYDALFHEIFNEPEREAVLANLASWLAQRSH